ncbi:MAG: TetR/AcrR family transcriptional regulator [Candidatus Abyssobacteria bacterium SURF_5]|uniref:Biofilm operon icaADBC HTH-type negative transcriptional regulator IcaR n=1 Tax=Abyssobacteria bacterium (strain SURF_5) TaxID=2093360 RepID=A0A3A4N6G9_ABYX5|nr:MAG: TetR/AcrR family transcriptional regulator [Candidatus Abyssubacteria bacterium SURF_5]
MAKRGRKSIADERRAQILDAFHVCAVRRGLENASLREVAEEAGLPVSNLHHFFKNRDEMVSELVTQIIGGIIADLGSELREESDPDRRFTKSIDFLFSPKSQKLEDGSLYYDFWSLAHRSTTVRSTFREQVRRQRLVIVDTLTKTPELAGLSRADMHEIANILIALVEGTFYILDMDGENVFPARMARLIRRFLELYAEEKMRGKKKKDIAP